MNETLTWEYEHINSELFVPEYPSGTNADIKFSMNSNNAGVGAINRLKSGKNVLFDYLVESDTNKINKTSTGNVKAFNLWNDTENGTKNYTINIDFDSTLLVYEYDESVLEEAIVQSTNNDFYLHFDKKLEAQNNCYRLNNSYVL